MALADKIAYVKSIYGDTLDYDETRVHRGGIEQLSGAIPCAIGNEIFMPEFLAHSGEHH